ncbi:MAG: hypothetical protein ABIL58_15110 [Pseudomonadota bacterium]
MTAARSFLVACCLTMIIAAGCAGTRLTNVWKDPAYKGSGVTSVLVIAVAQKQETRLLFEKSLAGALTRAGVTAVVSSDPLPQMSKLDKQDIQQAAMDARCDSVIITHLVGIENEEIHETPVYGRSMYNTGYGYGYYYSYAYEYVMFPGAVYDQTSVRLETNLYDAASETLLWRASSKTVDPKSVGGAIEDITAVLADNLKRDKMLSTK